MVPCRLSSAGYGTEQDSTVLRRGVGIEPPMRSPVGAELDLASKLRAATLARELVSMQMSVE